MEEVAQTGEVKREKLKSYEVRIEDKIYHRVPPWLEGIMEMGKRAAITPKPEAPSGSAAPAAPAAPLPPVVPPAPPPTAVSQPPPAPVAQKPKNGGTVTCRLSPMTLLSLRKVAGACIEYSLTSGPKRTLKLIDPAGNTLIDPSLGIQVDFERFIAALKEMNLTDGKRELG